MQCIFSAAMDPAEPYYGVMDPSIWVSKDDAEFVDIIHVNSDTLLGVRYHSIKSELNLPSSVDES